MIPRRLRAEDLIGTDSREEAEYRESVRASRALTNEMVIPDGELKVPELRRRFQAMKRGYKRDRRKWWAGFIAGGVVIAMAAWVVLRKLGLP